MLISVTMALPLKVSTSCAMVNCAILLVKSKEKG